MASIVVDKKVKNGRHDYLLHIERYNSAMEVADDLKVREITDSQFERHVDKNKIRHKSDWYYVKSYDEAIDLLHDGYEPQVTMNELKKIAAGDGKRIAIQNDIVGFAPVVPLALKGVPNCMLNTRIRPIKNKVIDVYFDSTYSSCVEAETIVENGKKLLGAIMATEQSGYRINLYAVQSYSDSDSADILAIKIKSSNQPFDLKRMSYPLMHPAFFRVIGFNWYARFKGATYRYGLGCYLSNNLRDNDLKNAVKIAFGDNAVYLSGNKILNETQQGIENELSDIGRKDG